MEVKILVNGEEICSNSEVSFDIKKYEEFMRTIKKDEFKLNYEGDICASTDNILTCVDTIPYDKVRDVDHAYNLRSLIDILKEGIRGQLIPSDNSLILSEIQKDMNKPKKDSTLNRAIRGRTTTI